MYIHSYIHQVEHIGGSEAAFRSAHDSVTILTVLLPLNLGGMGLARE